MTRNAILDAQPFDTPPTPCSDTSPAASPARDRRREDARLRRLIWGRASSEFGPLLLFFVVNFAAGLFWATSAFMAATAVSAGIGWTRRRRIPLVPTISLALLLIMGGATLWTGDAIWVLMRPTVMNGLPGIALLISVAVGRPALRHVIGKEARLTPAGWRVLTLSVGCFLVGLALVNELVWRSFGVDVWAAYKAFAFIPLNAAFIYSQWRLAQRFRR